LLKQLLSFGTTLSSENWGDLSFYKDAHRQDIVDADEEHADEELPLDG
jgi:hypothetical protein